MTVRHATPRSPSRCAVSGGLRQTPAVAHLLALRSLRRSRSPHVAAGVCGGGGGGGEGVEALEEEDVVGDGSIAAGSSPPAAAGSTSTGMDITATASTGALGGGGCSGGAMGVSPVLMLLFRDGDTDVRSVSRHRSTRSSSVSPFQSCSYSLGRSIDWVPCSDCWALNRSRGLNTACGWGIRTRRSCVHHTIR